MFITFEGIDGSGKTTQVKLLRKWLAAQGLKVLVTEEPTKGRIGLLISNYLKNPNAPKEAEALLFAADRAEHTEKVITPALKSGKMVICDRYTHSSIAYQSSMGLSKEWIKHINQGNLKPDLTIYLDIKPETGVKRVNKRGAKLMKYENSKMLIKVRKEYLMMKSNKFKVVDGEKSIKEVSEEVKRLINDIIR